MSAEAPQPGIEIVSHADCIKILGALPTVGWEEPTGNRYWDTQLHAHLIDPGTGDDLKFSTDERYFVMDLHVPGNIPELQTSGWYSSRAPLVMLEYAKRRRGDGSKEADMLFSGGLRLGEPEVMRLGGAHLGSLYPMGDTAKAEFVQKIKQILEI